MLRFASLLILIFIPFILISQNISGKIQNNEGVLSGIKITNITQNKSTYSGDNGDFTISAKVNDSIIFTSLFYVTKILRLTNADFEKKMFIRLINSIFELQEIVLQSGMEFKDFNAEEYNLKLRNEINLMLNNEIKEDMKRYPYKYGIYGENLIIKGLEKLVSNIFKRKKETSFIGISQKQLDSLFLNSDFFNEELLEHEFKIEERHRNLFFDYCEGQKMDTKLLNPKNNILLIDALVKCSNDFSILLKDYNIK